MDIEWLESTQLSNDSEDGQAYFELIKKIQAEKAKKKKDQQTQLLMNTQRNMEIAVTKSATNLNNVFVEMENSFEDMITEYAQIEDAARKLWLELIDEHEHFIALCDAKEAAFKLLNERREEQHDAACRSMKAACQELSRATMHIDFTTVKPINSGGGQSGAQP